MAAPRTLLTPTDRCASAISVKGLFDISCVKYRAGAPPCLPLPMDPSLRYGSPVETDAWCTRLIMDVNKILHDNVLNKTVVDLVDLPSPTVRLPRHTLLIVTPWTSDSSCVWLNVVRQVKCLVDVRLKDVGAHPHCQIGVEIMAPELRWPRHIVSFETRPNIKTDWWEIVQALRATFQLFLSTRDQVVAIDLACLGNHTNKDMNRLVIDVQLSYSSSETSWEEGPRDQAEKVLEKFGHRLELHLRHAYGFLDTMIMLPN